MSGMILPVIAAIIGVLLCGAGLYYLAKEKDDPESRKIYLITAGVGAILVLGVLVKVFAIGL